MVNVPLLFEHVYFYGDPSHLIASRGGDILIIRDGRVRWSVYVNPARLRETFEAVKAELSVTGGMPDGPLPAPGVLPALDVAGERALIRMRDMGIPLAEYDGR